MPDPIVPPCRTCGAEVVIVYPSAGEWFAYRECTNPDCHGEV